MIAVALSVIAVVVTVGPPAYNFISDQLVAKTATAPDFAVTTFTVDDTATLITIRNNGTAVAHNVRVRLMFYGSGLTQWAMTEFVPEIGSNAETIVVMPIGKYQLESAILPEMNVSANSYEADVGITCNELPEPFTNEFYFTHFIT
jgi:hypothetical protein